MKITTPTAGKLPAISEKQSLKQIRKLHGEIFDAVRTSLPKAIEIGELLAGIKARMERGQWLPWIEKNLPFSERSAQNYIRCFDEKDRLLSATDADLPLSVSGALALLSAPKSEPKPAPAPASRFDELNGQVLRATDCIDEVLPSDWIDKPRFEELVASGNIPLSHDDEIGVLTLGFAFHAGSSMTMERIIETLCKFNPARAQEAIA